MKIFNSNKIGVIGDLHLGKNKDDKWEKVFDDLLSWIEESYLGKVEDIIFLGDVFDGSFSKTREKGISFKTMDYVDKFFERLTKNFHVIVYAGNHCCYYKDRCDISALTQLKDKNNITVIDKTTDTQVGDRKYRIVPWSCLIEDEGSVDAVFGHFDIKTFKLNNVKSSDHGYSTKELFKVCDTVYTGHYHLRQERDYQKGSKKIFYVGSPLQLSWAEAGKESFIFILDLSKNEMVEEFRNNVSPKHIKLEASKIIESPKSVNNSILEVVWDIDENDENLLKVNHLLEKEESFGSKFNFNKDNEKAAIEMEKISSTINPLEILSECVDSMDIENKEKVLAKSTEILNIVI